MFKHFLLYREDVRPFGSEDSPPSPNGFGHLGHYLRPEPKTRRSGCRLTEGDVDLRREALPRIHLTGTLNSNFYPGKPLIFSEVLINTTLLLTFGPDRTLMNLLNNGSSVPSSSPLDVRRDE